MPKSSIASRTPISFRRWRIGHGFLGVMHQHALGQLELEQARGESGFAEHALDHADQVLLPELARREIHGDPQTGVAGLPGLRLGAGLEQHPFAERDDEPGVFGDRE